MLTTRSWTPSSVGVTAMSCASSKSPTSPTMTLPRYICYHGLAAVAAAPAPASRIDRRRIRPNILLEVDGDKPVEDRLVGGRCVLGYATLRILARRKRCVTTIAHDELPKDPPSSVQ
jgi:hypothetical protein